MADTINIACPNCDTPFEVPVEMIGETVECTECSVAFEILEPETYEEEYQEESEEAAEESGDSSSEAAGEEGSTHTVKMSRTSIGMVPSVEDSFNLDIVDQHIHKTSLRKSFESGEYAIGKPENDGEGGQDDDGSQGDKKWWKFWKK